MPIHEARKTRERDFARWPARTLWFCRRKRAERVAARRVREMRGVDFWNTGAAGCNTGVTTRPGKSVAKTVEIKQAPSSAPSIHWFGSGGVYQMRAQRATCPTGAMRADVTRSQA